MIKRSPMARGERQNCQGTASAVPNRDASLFGASAPEVRSFRFITQAAKMLAVALVALSPVLLAQTSYSQRAKEIGMHLKCQCRGCEMSAGGCAHPGGAFSGPCDTAKAMLKEVDQHLAKGESEQQIIDAFVAEYGSTVYIEPPKHGFGLVAWIMPVVYTLGGLVLVGFIVNKWRKRPVTAAPLAPALPNEKLDSVRAQIDRETED